MIDPAAFVGVDRTAPVVRLGGATMGTRWEVQAVLPRGVAADDVGAAINARLAGLVGEMSQWEPESVLSRFNRSAAGAWSVLPNDFAAVVAAALHIAAASEGAFDPTLGRVADLCGFGARVVEGAPDSVALATAWRGAGWRRLAFEAETRRLRQPGGLWLDLSGIAKGFAVDAVADLLRDMGVSQALVEIGGELVGRGVRPDGEPWWVDLEAPPGFVLAPLRVALHGIAVATSGDYRRGAHSFDPRMARAVENGVVSVSVIAGSAMIADAWATALTVLGADAGYAMAARQGLAARIVTAAGEEWLSPGLMAMLGD